MVSSRIVNIIKSVHKVLFFVTPSFPPKEYFENVDFLMTRYENAVHHNQYFKKRTTTTDPLPLSVLSCEWWQFWTTP